MHIPPHDNHNRAIVNADDALVPLVYFNIVKLRAGEVFDYRLKDYETCVVPAMPTAEELKDFRARHTGPTAA